MCNWINNQQSLAGTLMQCLGTTHTYWGTQAQINLIRVMLCLTIMVRTKNRHRHRFYTEIKIYTLNIHTKTLSTKLKHFLSRHFAFSVFSQTELFWLLCTDLSVWIKVSGKLLNINVRAKNKCSGARFECVYVVSLHLCECLLRTTTFNKSTCKVTMSIITTMCTEVQPWSRLW